MQDLIDTVSAFVDELPETQEATNKSFSNLEEFLNKEDVTDEPKHKILYQYRRETQIEWRKEKLIIDRTLARSYPVVRDLINSTYSIGMQENTLDKGLLNTIQPLQQQPQSPININLERATAKIPFSDKLKSFAGAGRKVEDVIENPWEASHDLIDEAKQVPNLWKKLVKAHATGVIKAYLFSTSMERYRDIELWYLVSHVEPELMKMIEASETILRSNDIKTIATILTKFYEQKEIEAKNTFG